MNQPELTQGSNKTCCYKNQVYEKSKNDKRYQNYPNPAKWPFSVIVGYGFSVVVLPVKFQGGQDNEYKEQNTKCAKTNSHQQRARCSFLCHVSNLKGVLVSRCILSKMRKP